MTPDDRLNAFTERMLVDAEALITWLAKHFRNDTGAVFFLCAVLHAIINTSWPTPKGRPESFTALLAVINELGAEIGPILAAIEVLEHDAEQSPLLH